MLTTFRDILLSPC